MFARSWFLPLLSAFCTFLFMPAHGAYGTIPERECEERKRASMEEHLGDTTMEIATRVPLKWDVKDVTIYFARIEFQHGDERGDTITYGCATSEASDSMGPYAGFAWVVVMPGDSTFSLATPYEYRSVDTSIGSYLKHEMAATTEDAHGALLVSGPFWRLGRTGESPIRALVRNSLVEQDFRPRFSAKYVLCSKIGDGIELMRGRIGMFEQSSAATCVAAIQVGPALFEPSTDGRAKLGIGGDSVNRSRRNILIKGKAGATGRRARERLVLLSTLFDIAAYDAMVTSELLMRKLRLGEIAWAVGLVDDESLSGPVLTTKGGPVLELVEAGRPTGAIMKFFFRERDGR